MQSVSNFWQTIKGQQILQLSICALVSLGYNIHLGIIEWDKASINIQAIMYFCGTLFILVVFVSIVTAPFHLDREREETIKEKEEKIKELKITIKPRKNAKPQIVTIEKPAPLPKPKNEPIIECKKVYHIKVDLSDDEEIPPKCKGEGKMLLVDFIYKRTENSYQKIYLRAGIKVDNLKDDDVVHTIKGIWRKDTEEYKEFIADDVWTVVVGIATVNKSLLLYEHKVENLWHLGYDNELHPIIYHVDGDNFDITVRLIADSSSDIIFNKAYNFKLSLEPEFSFKEAEN